MADFRLSALLMATAVWLLVGCDRRPEMPSREVLETYRAVAEATYADSLAAVEQLDREVRQLLERPSAGALAQARVAWRAARVPYSQSEAFRFGNWFVDEWEGRVNAWPIDEGFLDYVETPYLASPSNPNARANLVAGEVLSLGDRQLPTRNIDPALLISAQTLADVEFNIATGFHAVEFLLWGQDVERYEAGAGQRPWTDFSVDPAVCTDGSRAAPVRHCQRRGALLSAMLELLRRDLTAMRQMWGPQSGSYGDRLVKGDLAEGLRRMLFGLATLSSQELAGERLRVPLLAQAPEEEQDCFSDDTHSSLYFNAQGVSNIYHGHYAGHAYGAALSDWAGEHAPQLAAAIDTALQQSEHRLELIRRSAGEGVYFDQLIAPGHADGARLIEAAAAALERQAGLLEQLGLQMGLGSLNPQAPLR